MPSITEEILKEFKIKFKWPTNKFLEDDLELFLMSAIHRTIVACKEAAPVDYPLDTEWGRGYNECKAETLKNLEALNQEV